MYGHQGRLLIVDLGTGLVKVDTYDQEFSRKFLGGNGFAAKMIYDRVPSDVGPLEPANAVVFSVGPLTDTSVWGTSRGHVAAISPLTGLFCDSNFGGKFGTVQKRTGFDAICVQGKSPKPAFLLVTEEGAEIKDASAFWGKTTEETISGLQLLGGEGSVCAAIGPAGEKGVLFANIIGGGRRIGAAGRGGLGAVMGSKNLKALVVKGGRRTPIADRVALSRFLKERYEGLKGNTKAFTTYGTAFLVNSINGVGMMGTHNNSREHFDLAGDIKAETMRERFWKEDVTCHGCPVACGKRVTPAAGEFSGKRIKMPEYETLYAFGSMLDNHDLESIILANHLCELMGIDTISMGVTLAFVAECMEKGIVSKSELGGEVQFGNGPTLIELIRQTAYREGIGKLLSLGSVKLEGLIGKDSYKYLHAVKGLEIAGHSPRGLRGMSLSYAVGTRGGSHHDGRPSYLNIDPDPGFAPQPEYIVKNNHFTAVGDSLLMCRFTAERGVGTPIGEAMATMVNLVTGWSLSAKDLETMGERIYNLERLINVGRGVRRKDDTLPYRAMNEPITDGPARGRYCPKEELDKMLDEYYELRGWTRDGTPTPEKLEQLGLK
jgi:aldehyde:ferredoxin oxidoreductase